MVEAVALLHRTSPRAVTTTGHSVRVLGRLVGQIPVPPSLADEDRSDVEKPDDGREDCVRDHSTTCVVGELESKTAIDDTERNDAPAHPYMGVRPERAEAVLLE